MEKCKLTQVPCRKAIMDVVQTNKDRRSLQQTFELVKLFQMVVSDQASTLSEEDWERYFIIMKLKTLKFRGVPSTTVGVLGTPLLQLLDY